jgi:hypothetical protein
MTPEQAQKRIQELIHADLQEGTLAEVEVDDSIHDLTPFLFQSLKPSQAKGKKKVISPVGKKRNIAVKARRYGTRIQASGDSG